MNSNQTQGAVTWAAPHNDGSLSSVPGLHVKRTFFSVAAGTLPAGAGRQLRMNRHCPQTVGEGDSARLLVEVQNVGGESVRDTLLRVRFPSGLLHPAGESVAVPLGVLAPGEAAKIEFLAVAVEVGSQVIDIRLSATGVPEGRRQRTLEVLPAAPEEPGPGAAELAASAHILEPLLAEIDREATAFGEAPEAARRADERDGERNVVFALAGTAYAIPIGNVVEIGRLIPITPLPNVPDWLLGVGNFRGDILSLVDLRAFFGLEAGGAQSGGRLLVVRAQDSELLVGLIVDTVEGIRVLVPDQTRAPLAELQDRVVSFLRGVTEDSGHLLAMLDLDRLLRSPEMRQFEMA